jgi:hypothetical protein
MTALRSSAICRRWSSSVLSFASYSEQRRPTQHTQHNGQQNHSARDSAHHARLRHGTTASQRSTGRESYSTTTSHTRQQQRQRRSLGCCTSTGRRCPRTAAARPPSPRRACQWAASSAPPALPRGRRPQAPTPSSARSARSTQVARCCRACSLHTHVAVSAATHIVSRRRQRWSQATPRDTTDGCDGTARHEE